MFTKNESLIGLWGFLSVDNTKMIGLGGLIDLCEMQPESIPEPWLSPPAYSNDSSSIIVPFNSDVAKSRFRKN